MTSNKLVTLSNRLKEVKDKFEALQKVGIDRDILIMYIMKKTKLSKGNVLKMVEAQDEFYNKLVKTTISEKLEEGDDK